MRQLRGLNVVLCEHHIQNDQASKIINRHQVLIKTLIFIHRKNSNDLKSFQELMQWVKPRWNFSTRASNLASNLLKMIHILEGLQQAESPKYWMHVGCSQEYYWLTIQELNNLGNSIKYCFKIFDRGSWHEIYGDKILQLLSQEQKEFQPHVVQTLLETTRNESESVLSTVHIWLLQFVFFPKPFKGQDVWQWRRWRLLIIIM